MKRFYRGTIGQLGLHGEGARPLFYLIAIGVSFIFIAAVYTSVTSYGHLGTVTPRTMQFAETAKHLARAEGFRTDYIVPYALGYIWNLDEAPDIYSPPLYIVLLALFFKVAGVNEISIFFCTATLYAATIALIFAMGSEAIGIRGGIVGAVLFALNFGVMRHVVAGDNIPLLILLCTGLCYVIFKVGFQSLRGNVVIGVLLALCYLSSYSFGFMLVPIAIYAYFTNKGDRLKATSYIVLAFFVVSAPWLLRNLVVVANPFFNLSWVEAIKGPEFLRGGAPLPSKNLGITTLLRRTGWQASNLWVVYHNFIIIVLVASFFFRFKDSKLQTLRGVVCSLIGATWLIQLLNPPFRATSYLPFYPVIALLACGFIFMLLGFFGEVTPRAISVVAAVFVLVNIIPPRKMRWGRYGNYGVTYAAALSLAGPDRLIFSDVALPFAWYGDRKSIWLPYTLNTYNKVKRDVEKKCAVLLSDDFQDYVVDERAGDWKVPYEYALKGILMKRLGMEGGYTAGNTAILNVPSSRQTVMDPSDSE